MLLQSLRILAENGVGALALYFQARPETNPEPKPRTCRACPELVAELVVNLHTTCRTCSFGRNSRYGIFFQINKFCKLCVNLQQVLEQVLNKFYKFWVGSVGRGLAVSTLPVQAQSQAGRQSLNDLARVLIEFKRNLDLTKRQL